MYVGLKQPRGDGERYVTPARAAAKETKCPAAGQGLEWTKCPAVRNFHRISTERLFQIS